MVRLAHISDVHITTPRLPWQWRDLYTKRVTTWVNYRWLGRREHFLGADAILSRFMEELPGRQIDRLVFSGDATALGFESEFRRAAEILRVADPIVPGFAIPGNHDYCTPRAAASGFFERHFDPWQDGQRIDSHRYPFAQKVGPVWLVGVNAAVGHRVPWNASGRVGVAQLDRLRQLLASLDDGPRVLVVHYPVMTPAGLREPRHHGLRDLDAVVRVASAGGAALWLHGHRHDAYHVKANAHTPFPVICAGSTTQDTLHSYGEYTLDGNRLFAVRRAYNLEKNTFEDVEAFELALPG